MELGGVGLFRPEVTIPLGVDVPVIAWGLGLSQDGNGGARASRYQGSVFW